MISEVFSLLLAFVFSAKHFCLPAQSRLPFKLRNATGNAHGHADADRKKHKTDGRGRQSDFDVIVGEGSPCFLQFLFKGAFFAFFGFFEFVFHR